MKTNIPEGHKVAVVKKSYDGKTHWGIISQRNGEAPYLFNGTQCGQYPVRIKIETAANRSEIKNLPSCSVCTNGHGIYSR